MLLLFVSQFFTPVSRESALSSRCSWHLGWYNGNGIDGFSFDCVFLNCLFRIFDPLFEFLQAVFNKLKIYNVTSLHIEIQVLVFIVKNTLSLEHFLVDSRLLLLSFFKHFLQFVWFVCSGIDSIDKSNDIGCLYCWDWSCFCSSYFFFVLLSSFFQFLHWSN